MERVKQILDASLLYRALAAVCLWCGDQWRSSAVVRWFLHPRQIRSQTRKSRLLRVETSPVWEG